MLGNIFVGCWNVNVSWNTLHMIRKSALALGLVAAASALRAPVRSILRDPLETLSARYCRGDRDEIEGVHADPTHELTQRVLASVPELSSWEDWYTPPSAVSANGHLHTILAAKLRRTAGVYYHRLLVGTPDGGTLAIDLLAGLERVKQTASGRTVSSSLLTGGSLPGAAEEDGFARFVSEPPAVDLERPMLVGGPASPSSEARARHRAVTRLRPPSLCSAR